MDMHPAAAPISILLVCFTQRETRRHTEQQFRGIFAQPMRMGTVQLTCITLEPAERAMTTAILQAANPGALIVTGMQPHTPSLADEKLWPTLTALVDFATTNVLPTLWSCLAAHAAVLHLDGIDRRRLPEKLAGLIECRAIDAAHPFLAGLPRRWKMPHSRYNDVARDQLERRGYRILSTTEQDSADIFANDTYPHFLFCQGHPEYDAHALLREYRRDIRQFLAGQTDHYPANLQSYFSPGVISLLDEFKDQAQRRRTPGAMSAFPADACAADVTHSWRDLSTLLFANWLAPSQAASTRAHQSAGAW